MGRGLLAHQKSAPNQKKSEISCFRSLWLDDAFNVPRNLPLTLQNTKVDVCTDPHPPGSIYVVSNPFPVFLNSNWLGCLTMTAPRPPATAAPHGQPFAIEVPSACPRGAGGGGWPGTSGQGASHLQPRSQGNPGLMEKITEGMGWGGINANRPINYHFLGGGFPNLPRRT